MSSLGIQTISLIGSGRPLTPSLRHFPRREQSRNLHLPPELRTPTIGGRHHDGEVAENLHAEQLWAARYPQFPRSLGHLREYADSAVVE